MGTRGIAEEDREPASVKGDPAHNQMATSRVKAEGGDR